MTLKDYYIANPDNNNLYVISGVGYADICHAIGGTTFEEAEQELNRILNSSAKEDIDFVSNYRDLRIVKHELTISNGKIYPRAISKALEKISYNT